MSKENPLSQEQIAAVKELIEPLTGVNFETFLAAYREHNSDIADLTEADLISEILEVGDYQDDETQTSFEDAVTLGSHMLGETLDLF